MTLVHVTHWKAASQWMLGILDELFGSAVEHAENFEAQLFTRPVKADAVYGCAYVNHHEFRAVPFPGPTRYFVLIRDLRDTLTSVYFSVKFSHGVDVPILQKQKTVLLALSEEDGLIYLMETWLNQPAFIQKSWVDAGEQCFRLEDCMKDAAGQLEKMFCQRWGLAVERSVLEDVAARHSFEKLSRGREAGKEDVKSHYRKGVAGDWRGHFTPKITARFKELYGDLLIRTGYERDNNW
jgi:hypothetical protein